MGSRKKNQTLLWKWEGKNALRRTTDRLAASIEVQVTDSSEPRPTLKVVKTPPESKQNG